MSTWVVTLQGNGTFDKDFTFPEGVINSKSIVFVNICEISRIRGVPNDIPWPGDASLEIRQIVPQDTGHLIVRVAIDWDSPLLYRLFFLVL